MVDREFADLAAEAEEEHLADLAGAAAIIGGALTAFLLRQLPRIGRNLREFGVPERAWESFSEIDEVATLRKNLRPAFDRVVEAQVVKDVVRLPGSAERSSKRGRSMPSKLEAAVAYQRRWSRFGKKLPDALRNAVNHATETAITQQYWSEVATSQLELAEKEFAASLKEISNRQRAADETIKRLKKRVKSRAASGGETEANGAVNAGHAIVGDVRAVAGLEDFKTWMTVADERVRKTHQALHRVAVARTAMFSVGGHLAPHPGWWELPIQERIRCFVPWSKVQGVFTGAQKASYDGMVTEIVTRSGRKLTVTEQHPVLTTHGMVAAGLLNRGQYVVTYRGQINSAFASGPGRDDVEHEPVPIEQVFQSVRSAAVVVKVSGAEKDDFYGDGLRCNGQIEVVRADRELSFGLPSGGAQKSKRGILAFEDSAAVSEFRERLLGLDFGTHWASGRLLPGVTALADDGVPVLLHRRPFQCLGVAAGSGGNAMSGENIRDRLAAAMVRRSQRFDGLSGIESSNNRRTVEWKPAFSASDVLLSAGLDPNSAVSQTLANGPTADAHRFSDFVERFPGVVEADEIVDVKRYHYRGPVFDCTSPYGMIVSDGIVTSNCRCWLWLGAGADTFDYPLAEELRISVF